MRPNHKNNNNNNSVDNTDNDLRSPLQQHTVKFSNCISNQDDIFSSSSSCSSSNQNDDTIKIRIKSNIQNTKDVTITIPQSFTVHQLKDEIRSSCFTSTTNNDENNATLTHPKNDNLQHTPHDILPISKDRYLRLICSGRLLAPDSSKVSDFNSIKDGSVIHAVLSAPGIRLVFIQHEFISYLHGFIFPDIHIRVYLIPFFFVEVDSKLYYQESRRLLDGIVRIKEDFAELELVRMD